MTNTDLITAYLDNELSDADRIHFEDRLKGDSELQQELALQKDVIEGIRMARTAELKQLMNNVPVGQTTFWSMGKIASVIAVVAIGVIGIYYFTSEDDIAVPADVTNETITQNTPAEPSGTETVQEDPVTEQAEPRNEAARPEVKTADETADADESQPEDKRPVVAPTFERNDTEREEIIAPGGTILGERVETPTNTEVEIDRNNTAFTFHYRFEPGMLKLYGDFNNELYQILEFNSEEGQNWFLEYEDKYYYLDDSSQEVRPLEEISDAGLLDRLRNVR